MESVIVTAKGRDILADARLGPQLRVLDGIAAWCGGLHGAMALREALQALSDGFGAEAAALSRHLKTETRPRSVALSDMRADVPDLPALTRALAVDVMGYFYDHARPATLWFLSDHLADEQWQTSQSLTHWQAARDIEEIVVVVLARNARQSDFIEFHFTRALERSEKLEFETLLPTIVRSWAGRQTGLVTQAGMDARVARARAAASDDRFKWEQPLLDMANPANLSRAEFRVCLLLSRGLSVKGVTDELGLTEATVRTHLRSIYAKTETSSLAELLYRILSAGKPEAAPVETGRRRA
ncbi:MAG: helix-turn-helix transcriptional regulator [Silicimonas sp.]|nr:helix-turn-helix transcriptional regulator [Silicimonas sp.]